LRIGEGGNIVMDRVLASFAAASLILRVNMDRLVFPALVAVAIPVAWTTATVLSLL
jgi:hypothetical protein